ncbi:MAG: nicotinate (nicotinamide) nucleotide adenylyltransferase [Phycisphaerales bacterium]|nr:nicotinate (nicotinamide) nucleotide adenylyltransferase [Phycisphaerales bacterium]MBT7171739.1 nicotinate (nicotinamide) nucleotide adenylyltransferase [Phycisphaerales bacterium]
MNLHNAILLGGSFDPVHRGHLEIATFVASAVGAESVVLLPTACNPLKTPPVANDAQRLAMLELAAQSDPRMIVSEFELQRGASYTIDTIEALERDGASDLMLLIGADNLRDLSRWRRVEDLLAKVRLLVACRPPDGFAQASEAVNALEGMLPDALVDKVRTGLIETPLIDISSTAIREAIARGEPCQSMVPAGVWDYIEREGLYRSC